MNNQADEHRSDVLWARYGGNLRPLLPVSVWLLAWVQIRVRLASWRTVRVVDHAKLRLAMICEHGCDRCSR